MRAHSPLLLLRLTTLAVALLLAGCEIPGMGPDPRIAARVADGKAIGSACRHALRGIEDCYVLNEKALKTAVFEGWKEMDQYMRDNKIEGAPPKVVKAEDPPEEEVVAEPKAKTGAKEKPAAEAHSKADTTKAKPAVKVAQHAEGH
jgi:membrane protein involved in colicin uptake